MFNKLCSVCVLMMLKIAAAQINTPSGATKPFNSNSSYEFGIMPTNLPTTGTYTRSTAAADAYNSWKTTYVEDCGSGRIRVKFDNPAETVSEGIAYGMQLAAYAADKTLFDGLYAYYKYFSNSNKVMNWKINGCNSVAGNGGATDAELDAAFALIIASEQWPNATDPYIYKNEATTLITAIKDTEIHPTSFQTINGDGWGFSNNCRNPSYFSPAYYREFAKFVPSQATFWNNVINATNTYLTNNRNAATGLVSNWSDQNATPNNCNGPNEYGYDACRNPWRMAKDVIWNGTTIASVASDICNKLATWHNGKHATMKGPISMSATDASTGQSHNAIFVSTWSCGVMGANSSFQTHLNNCYTETVSVTANTNDYFGATLRTISLFMLTGNYWKPGTTSINCQTPSINNGQSVVTFCGVDLPSPGLVLNSGLASAQGRSFTWYKGTTQLSGANSPTLTLTTSVSTPTTGPGTYKVVVDSAGCFREDEITVSAHIPTPTLGADKTLCNPSSTTLDANVTGSGLSYKWEADQTLPYNISGLVELTGETGPSLTNVRKAGLYRVTVSATGCSNAFGTVTVNSSLPTPVDNCVPVSGQSASLSIENPGLDGSNYNWYASATGGTALATNTLSFTTPILSSTTTYYVQNMGAQSVTVGRTAITNPSSVWDINDFTTDDKKLKFTVSQNLTIDSLTVYLTTAGNVTIRITTESGTLVTSKTFNSLGAGARRLGLAFNLTPATYLIDASGTSVQLQMEGAGSTGIAYPYTAHGLISITNNASWAGSWYPLFYNWRVSTGSVCARLPVVAQVGNCTMNCNLPLTNKTVTGSSSCSGTDATITVASSENGVSYRPYKGNTPISTAVSGNGNTITLVVPFTELVAGGNVIGVRGTNSCGTSNLNNAVVEYNVPTLSNAGINQTVSSSTTTLNANNPSSGTGEWSLVSGVANILSPTQNNTTVNGLQLNTTAVLKWTISLNGCKSESQVQITRTDPNSLSLDLADKPRIFPNPSNDFFTLDLHGMHFHSLQVYDQTGALIIQTDKHSNLMEIGHDWLPGLYHLRLLVPGRIETHTLMKK